MIDRQAIKTPLGITVFGSHVLRVEPDRADLSFTLESTTNSPAEAMHAVHEKARGLLQAIESLSIRELHIQSSRVTLQLAQQGYGKDAVFMGYRARVGLNVILDQIERLEELLLLVADRGRVRLKRQTTSPAS